VQGNTSSKQPVSPDHDDAISLMQVLVPHHYIAELLLHKIDFAQVHTIMLNSSAHKAERKKGSRRSHRSDETKHLFTPYDVAVGSRPLRINYDYHNRKFCCYVKKCNMYCAASFFCQFLFN
jgi:hypothetical protein